MKIGIKRMLAVGFAAAACYTVLQAQAPSRSVNDGVFTKEQAQRGEGLYKQHCGSCHGQALEGIEMAPALTGGDFIDRWSGQTLGDLFERLRATMPADKPGKLSRDVNTEITAYILSFNRYPAGSVDLSRDTQVMKQIKIDPPKAQ